MDTTNLHPTDMTPEAAKQLAVDLVTTNGISVQAFGDLVVSPALDIVENTEAELAEIYRPLVKQGTRAVVRSEKELEQLTTQLIDQAHGLVASNHGQLGRILEAVQGSNRDASPDGSGGIGNDANGNKRGRNKRQGTQTGNPPIVAGTDSGQPMSGLSGRDMSATVPIGGTGSGSGQTSKTLAIGTEPVVGETQGSRESPANTDSTLPPTSPVILPPSGRNGPMQPEGSNFPPFRLPGQKDNCDNAYVWMRGSDGVERCYCALTGEQVTNDKCPSTEPPPPPPPAPCYVPPPRPVPGPIIIENPTCPKPEEQCPNGQAWAWNKYTGMWECTNGGIPPGPPPTDPPLRLPDCQELIDNVKFNLNLTCDQLPEKYRKQLDDCGFKVCSPSVEMLRDKPKQLSPEWIALIVRAALLMGSVLR